LESALSYRIYSRFGAYGQLEDYFLWAQDAELMGVSVGEGRPFQIRICLVGGQVINGQVQMWSTLRMDLFIFMENSDRDKFLLAERFDPISIYDN
jgi:hypothetical protein